MTVASSRVFNSPLLSALALLGMALLVSLGLVGSQAASAEPDDHRGLPVAALPGYHVDLFARGTSAFSNPDAIAVANGHVFVAFANHTAKDGSDHQSSTIVDYTREGRVAHLYTIEGHCDGMRLDPSTHRLWILMNNDANPVGFTLDPRTGDLDRFTFPPTPHGGGYDDLTFIGGKAFISASNPTLNGAGANVFPAVDSIVLKNGKAELTPVLAGNPSAVDTTTTPPQTVTLNLTDPDSMSRDPAGDVVLVDQAGSQLVFLHHAGTSNQTVSRVPTGTQLEDPVWVTRSEGLLYVVDSAQNAIYTLSTDFKPGTVYTEAPSDSGVASLVGTLDVKTGTVTPIAIGFTSPTGLIFVAGEDED